MIDYKVDDIVKGKVSGIEDYGIFILLDDDFTGLIHISEISHSFVKNISDYVKIGDIIFAKVIGIDDKNKKLKLSIKDIDYKHDGKKMSRILETKSGFNKLQASLDGWIEEKTVEIKKNN